jgi:hypothetical protein
MWEQLKTGGEERDGRRAEENASGEENTSLDQHGVRLWRPCTHSHQCSTRIVDARTWHRTIGAMARDSLRPHDAVGSPYTWASTQAAVLARWLPL